MNYGEALKKFNTDETVCIVVETEDGLKVVSDYNFCGGVCSCCHGFTASNNLEVVRVVDMATMDVFYEKIKE